MPPKLVSVIIPAKDAEKTIGECLQAVISQRELYFEYEVIVVDDGSQDRTADIAANFGVQVVRQQNTGPGGARNTGVAEAR
ncbi:MAG: glycosyltransferase, partial [Chloroflexi bacterium]|nr:glycosyltransferase [Chloroflexota bacterium]